MSGETSRLDDRAAELRRAFDGAFAVARRDESEPDVDLLAIRIATDRYALRLAEIASLFADRKILRLPGPLPELIGLTGFRGVTFPVYDLRVLLGYPASAAPRWLVIAAGREIALAFDGVDRHLRVPRGAIAASDLERPRRHVHEVVRDDEVARPIVRLPSVLEAIQARTHHGISQQEG